MTEFCVIVAGVRPQYIKAAALGYEIGLWEKRNGRQLRRLVIDTGQHYSPELSLAIQRELSLHPNIRLSHDRPTDPSLVLASTIGQLGALARSWPATAVVVVFGDANPALAGAVVARMAGLKVVHIEAGERRLRTEQEDFNSRVVDVVADLALCVTWEAMENLANEGFRGEAIRTGDLAYRWFEERVAALDAIEGGGVLVTMHRAHHMDPTLLRRLAERVSDLGLPVEWVSHPRSEAFLTEALHGLPIKVLRPQGNSDFIRRMRSAAMVVTDSGGAVREAHMLGTPVVVIRDAGAWPVLDAKYTARVGADLDGLAAALEWAASRLRGAPRESPLVDVAALERGVDKLVAHCLED